ncbi:MULTISPECIES: cytochrome c family protein [unclassified Bradyrhizobium]|uniref:c-type cytochrome n=1 Tax=unclassified Bradyrhizobium TaxID=2631580 RepID=UPI0020B1DB6A|nr:MULTISPECIES: cytochrome c family protein [unclassified Bradyrhizobium]MCP3379463.1 cytochrome c family protein [Bradyrhizobium sp. CCGUVB4N]MCP3440212.1 cytochrome c family protein [Bradyrhizobium sp. CCGUVB14]
MNVRSNSVLPRSTTSPALAAIAIALLCAAGPAGATGNVARGQTLYKGCADCHSIAENGVGPMHKGVVGRKAGSVPGYDYSPDLKNSGIVWTEENLDKWLTGPQAMVPETKMFFDVPDAQDRADIIAYLKEKAR